MCNPPYPPDSLYLTDNKGPIHDDRHRKSNGRTAQKFMEKWSFPRPIHIYINIHIYTHTQFSLILCILIHNDTSLFFGWWTRSKSDEYTAFLRGKIKIKKKKQWRIKKCAPSRTCLITCSPVTHRFNSARAAKGISIHVSETVGFSLSLSDSMGWTLLNGRLSVST